MAVNKSDEAELTTVTSASRSLVLAEQVSLCAPSKRALVAVLALANDSESVRKS